MQPNVWTEDSSQLNLKEWFNWPGDIFALTSKLLLNTGGYRHVTTPPVTKKWPRAFWLVSSSFWQKTDDVRRRQKEREDVEELIDTLNQRKNDPESKNTCLNIEALWPSKSVPDLANEWLDYLSQIRLGEKPQVEHPLLFHMEVLGFLSSEVIVEDLYRINQINDEYDYQCWMLCCVLLELHAVADEAFKGLGILYSIPAQYALLALEANFLLVTNGTLSRISKYNGIVLPKMRTPSVGLTLRSLSHHLTYHATEVDVAWYSGPWINRDEDTLNIMIVPWPYKISAKDFKSQTHPKTMDKLGPNRYFVYDPQGQTTGMDSKSIDEEGDLSFKSESLNIVKRLVSAQQEVHRIHLIVFPEMSLRKADLDLLQKDMKTHLEPHQMPMIIAGVSNMLGRRDEDTDEAMAFENPDAGKGFNRVVLSCYYAQKWYDIIQDKHHRWRMDEGQIKRYRLSGVLTGGRTWWESIKIPRRRISFFAPNAWLTICPLICEDLARLEPVSDVIRGVGPTLLTAVLLDGPQIRTRWSSRYASVFADDPGSSVLTISAYGMTERSNYDLDEELNITDQSAVIALWKEDSGRWKEIKSNISKEDKNQNEDDEHCHVITISGSWTESFTTDGRSDYVQSTSFKLLGDFIPGKNETYFRTHSKECRANKRKKVDSPPQMDEKERFQPVPAHEDDEYKADSIRDMCELSLFTHFVNMATISEEVDINRLSSFATSMNFIAQTASGFGQPIANMVQDGIKYRDLIPSNIPTPSYILSIDIVKHFINDAGKLTKESIKKLLGEKWKEKLPLSFDDLPLTFDCKLYVFVSVALEQFGKAFTSKAKRNKTLSKNGEALKEQLVKSSIEAFELGRKIKYEKEKDGLKLTIKKLRMKEASQVYLSACLTTLWAIHRRLTERRRNGELTTYQADLMIKVETVLESDYETPYNRWVESVR